MRNKRRGNSKRRKTGEGESSSRFIKMQKSRGIAKISFSRIAANLFGFVSLAWRVSGIAFLSLLEREEKILKLERERERGGRRKFSDIEDESFPSKESCYESDETWKLIALSEANSPALEIYLEGIENETGRLWILHETGLFSKSLKVNPLAGTTSAPRGSRVNFTILTSRWNRIINDHYTMNFFPLSPSSKNTGKERVRILKTKFTNRSRWKDILYFFVFVIFRCTKNEKYLDFDFFFLLKYSNLFFFNP